MSDIKRYFISLGKSCNMNCIYCHQGEDKPTFSSPICTEGLNKDNIKKLISHMPKDGKYIVTMYGGEPLLYWDILVPLADALKNNNPNITIGMPTNGLLLTTAKAIKLNELGVNVGLSHDGRCFEQTRGIKDILKVNPEPFLTLNNRNISAVASKVNYDFYDIWGYFEDFTRINNTGREKESIYIHVIKDVEDNTPENLLIYNMPEFEQMLDRVFINLEKQIIAENFSSYEYMQYRGFIETLNYRLNFPEMIGVWCGADKQVAHLDMEGNLYTCHNVQKPYGNIDDFNGIRPGSYNPFLQDKECVQCPAYIICGGGCPVSAPDKRKYMCYVMYQQITRMYKLLEKITQLQIFESNNTEKEACTICNLV